MNEKECATILKRLVYNKDDSEVYDAIIFAIRSLQQREMLVECLELSLKENNLWAEERCDCPGEGHICGFPRLKRTIEKCEQLLAEIKGEQKEPHMEKQMSMEELRKSEDRWDTPKNRIA